MRVAIQMDHPAVLNPHSDSTVILGLEAQRRGIELYFYQPHALSYAEGEIIAHPAYPIRFIDGGTPFYELGEPERLELADMDAVLMRQDPPFDMAYLSATYLLELLDIPVVNDPTYVRNAPEKLAIFSFPEFIPPTLVTADRSEIARFQDHHAAIIVKPLYGHGGRSVYKFERGDSNLETLLEQFASISAEPLMVQAFLPEVVSEDRRIILMNGTVSAAIGRIPPEGSVRANFRVGGTAAKAELSPRQQLICDAVGAQLAVNGVLFAGLDLIGDYLTEINITSPTGLRAALDLYGINAAAHFWDALEDRV